MGKKQPRHIAKYFHLRFTLTLFIKKQVKQVKTGNGPSQGLNV